MRKAATQSKTELKVTTETPPSYEQALKQKVETLEEELQSLRAELALSSKQKDTQIHQLENTIKQLREDKKNVTANFSNELDAIEAELDKKNTLIANQRAEILDLRRSLASLNGKAKEMYDSLFDQYQEVASERDALKCRSATLMKQIEEFQKTTLPSLWQPALFSQEKLKSTESESAARSRAVPNSSQYY